MAPLLDEYWPSFGDEEGKSSEQKQQAQTDVTPTRKTYELAHFAKGKKGCHATFGGLMGQRHWQPHQQRKRDCNADEANGATDPRLFISLVERVLPSAPPREEPEQSERQRAGSKGCGGREALPEIVDERAQVAHEKSSGGGRLGGDPVRQARAMRTDGALQPLAHMPFHPLHQPHKPAEHQNRRDRSETQHHSNREASERGKLREQGMVRTVHLSKIGAFSDGGARCHTNTSSSARPSARNGLKPMTPPTVAAILHWSTALSSTLPLAMPGPRTCAQIS